MKKGIVLFAVMLFCLSGFAKGISESWVVTSNGKMDVKKINLGYNKARVVLENGEKTTINFNSINSFCMYGRTYVKLRLFENNRPTDKMAFMEQVATWNDLTLYKLPVRDLETVDSQEVSYRFYLYKGMNYHLLLDDRTLENTAMHFGLTMNDIM